MFPIVCFKWKSLDAGYKLPAVTEYSAVHVNILHNMLKRNLSVPFKLFCITDQSYGISSEVETIPLWDTYRNLGGCFSRLYVFDRRMAGLVGPRFLCLDMDCVIVRDMTPILQRPEDFIMNSYKPCPGEKRDQYYNGSMIMMTAGARETVWKGFDPERSPGLLKDLERKNMVIGSDQAWIRHILGKGEARFTEEDGVYEYRQVQKGLPSNARIVFFSGRRDPSMKNDDWVKRHWK
jgi:hypothetical protein